MVVTLPSWLLALTALPPASLPVTNHFSITKVIGYLSQDLMLQHHPLPAFLSPATRCFPPAGLTSTAAGERREREQVRGAAEARAYNLTRTAVQFVRATKPTFVQARGCPRSYPRNPTLRAKQLKTSIRTPVFSSPGQVGVQIEARVHLPNEGVTKGNRDAECAPYSSSELEVA